MKTQPVYAPEVRERAVRLVFTSEHEHSSRWSATQSVAGKIGCTPETLRKWIRQVEIDQGGRSGLTTDHAQKFKELEREVRELKRANEILRKAAAFFAQAEFDRRPRYWCHLLITIETTTVSSRSAPYCRSHRRRIIASNNWNRIRSDAQPVLAQTRCWKSRSAVSGMKTDVFRVRVRFGSNSSESRLWLRAAPWSG